MNRTLFLYQCAQLLAAVWAVIHFGWLVLLPLLFCASRLEYKL